MPFVQKPAILVNKNFVAEIAQKKHAKLDDLEIG